MSYYDKASDLSPEERKFYNKFGAALLIISAILLALLLTWFILFMEACS